MTLNFWVPEGQRVRFEYSPADADRRRAESRLEKYWREDTLRRAESILRYGGAVAAMLGTGGIALEDAEKKAFQDLHTNSVVRAGGLRPVPPV